MFSHSVLGAEFSSSFELDYKLKTVDSICHFWKRVLSDRISRERQYLLTEPDEIFLTLRIAEMMSIQKTKIAPLFYFTLYFISPHDYYNIHIYTYNR